MVDGVLGLTQIHTCGKVPLLVNLLDDDILYYNQIFICTYNNICHALKTPANRNTFNILPNQSFICTYSTCHAPKMPANRNTFNIWLQPIRASSVCTSPSMHQKCRPIGTRITFDCNQSELYCTYTTTCHAPKMPANRNTTFKVWLQPIRASSARTTSPAMPQKNGSQ